MPWCETCAKFWNPNSMPVDGTCPACHRPIATSQADRSRAPRDDAVPSGATAQGTDTVLADERTKVPWHFWVMVACIALYLGWRVVQLVGWLVAGIAG